MGELLTKDNETSVSLEEKSYIYGLLITDGTLHLKNQETYTGQMFLEINKKDEDIIDKLCNIVPYSTKTERIRNTNFKEQYHSVKFSISRQNFIKELIEFGFPVKEKTLNAKPPILAYDQNAFWRGVIDGDGSIGIRHRSNSNKLEPYLSLVTKSEVLKEEFCKYAQSITGKEYNPKRNKRDNIYNIGIGGKMCCKILREIYKNATIYLDRKYNKHLECLEWDRSKNDVSQRNK